MQVFVHGLGAFGPGFENWQDLQNLLAGHGGNDDALKAPKPAVIPANERRRAPLAVRIAVETASQAIAMSDIPATEAACVFASGLGDTDLTDYMCKVLAGPDKQLSPTKFHNSVHNAAAGYWTIATHCRQPANSIAGLGYSVSIALLEGMVQCITEQRPVLLAFYDTATSQVLSRLFSNEQAFGFAMLISPSDDTGLATRLDAKTVTLAQPKWPTLNTAQLEHLYAANPAAKSLCLAKALTAAPASKLSLPLSQGSALEIDVKPCTAWMAAE